MADLQFNGYPKCPCSKNATTGVVDVPKKIKSLKVQKPGPAESTVKGRSSRRK